jgi:hypothetical protein|tara:strand:+ start:7738 stop:8469 length:732 start_codon:yes stop_codon:yes gene_type:complete
MALDMAKMKAKLQELESGGKSKSDNVWWRPQEGDQDIRLVPTEDGDPFKVYHFHYNLGEGARGGILCPKRQFGDNCPVCDFASKLWQEGTEESKKMAKSLFVRQRFFSPVIVRGEEEQGVKIWGYGKTIYETLLGLVLNPDYGDITDTDSGVDFTLNYTLPKTKGAFPQTNLVPKRKSSALASSKAGIKEILEQVPEIDSLFQRKSTTDVKNILEAFLNPIDGPSVDDVGISSVDEAIRELSA